MILRVIVNIQIFFKGKGFYGITTPPPIRIFIRHDDTSRSAGSCRRGRLVRRAGDGPTGEEGQLRKGPLKVGSPEHGVIQAECPADEEDQFFTLSLALDWDQLRNPSEPSCLPRSSRATSQSSFCSHSVTTPPFLFLQVHFGKHARILCVGMIVHSTG